MFSVNNPLSELLADYINGKLSGEDMKRVESALQTDSDLAAEHEFLKQVSSSLKSDTDEFVPGEFGWAKLSRAIDMDANTAPETLNIDSDYEETEDLAETNISRFKRPQFWRYAAIALVCISVGQAALLSSGVMNGQSETLYIPVSGDPVHTAPTVTITFVPTATEASIRDLIISHDAEIVSGPSASGLYKLKFSTNEKLNKAVISLKVKADIVDVLEVD